MKRGPMILIVCLVAGIILAFGATIAGVYFIHSVLWWKPSAEECLRFPLPTGSRVVAEAGHITHGGSRWFVIEMSRDQFDQFKAAGGFAHRPDLQSYWPASLWSPEQMGHPPGCPWMADPLNDEFTVYRQVNGATDVGRWEDGRLFYKHHVS